MSLNREIIKKRYIKDMAEAFNLSMNEQLVNLWVANLVKYEEDVLKSGWNEFLLTVLPDRTPELSRALVILEKHREIKETQKRIVEFQKEKSFVDEKPNTYASKVCQGILRSLNKAWIADGGRRMYHKDQADFWANEMNDKEMERKHNACNS